MISLDDATQFMDNLSAVPPREELNVFSDGRHVLLFRRRNGIS
jgi:hypothetical protein